MRAPRRSLLLTWHASYLHCMLLAAATDMRWPAHSFRRPAYQPGASTDVFIDFGLLLGNVTAVEVSHDGPRFAGSWLLERLVSLPSSLC